MDRDRESKEQTNTNAEHWVLAKDGLKYRTLGESGLVEDEEGNMYSASEIFPPEKPNKPIRLPEFQRNSFVSELDNKCNASYWYYHYDERYCGPDRERWMEEMAKKHREMRQRGVAMPTLGDKTKPEPKPDHTYHLCEATKARADMDQDEVIRLGIHSTYRKDFNYIRGLGFISVVDQFGNVILNNERYKFVGRYLNYGLAMAQDRNTELWGYVDRHGHEVVRCQWRSVGHFSEYLAAVQNDKRKCGYVDVKGYLAVPCKWDEAWPFREGVAKVESNKRLGLIDQSGNIVVPCTWRGMGEMSNGLINVMDESGKCGYIDKSGKVVIPCQWRQAWSFKDGLAIVQDDKRRLGFINTRGEVVIPCRWKRANPFDGSLARVSDRRRFPFGFKWVYIDRTGKVVREE